MEMSISHETDSNKTVLPLPSHGYAWSYNPNLATPWILVPLPNNSSLINKEKELSEVVPSPQRIP